MATIDETINEAFKPIASAFNDLVFYSIPIGESQLPLIVVWLIEVPCILRFIYDSLISEALHTRFGLFSGKKTKQIQRQGKSHISEH